MKSLTYISACMDNSGYAEAARNNICCLAEAGLDIAVLPVSFETFHSDLGLIRKKVSGLIAREPRGNIQTIHTTPNIFRKFHRADKYNIGYTTWETT